uniref:Uncharacterized protein n=1 Tax=Nelumbo nucifera TaxID=4432 RepID=A0A822ZXC2_NELNU|nr:TPA_asm: hypothetical protein HUJ06_017806 [Nelumbo nucifera]
MGPICITVSAIRLKSFFFFDPPLTSCTAVKQKIHG